MWKINKDNWEYVVIDEPEGQIVIKTDMPVEDEKVLIDTPEGQVVVKKARKPRKKGTAIKTI